MAIVNEVDLLVYWIEGEREAQCVAVKIYKTAKEAEGKIMEMMRPYMRCVTSQT